MRMHPLSLKNPPGGAPLRQYRPRGVIASPGQPPTIVEIAAAVTFLQVHTNHLKTYWQANALLVFRGLDNPLS